LANRLPTPQERVRTLQTSLQAKAKAEPAYRFYSLWDKICRSDVLHEAYRRCRQNAGAPGCDGETFEAIDGRSPFCAFGLQRAVAMGTGRWAFPPCAIA
jgi:hypothetical protein